MSLIDDYTNQTVNLKARNGMNAYGESTYAAPVPIRVRWEFSRKLVKDRTGREVTSSAKVWTSHPVGDEDVLTDAGGRDWPVLALGNRVLLDGNEDHREVFL